MGFTIEDSVIIAYSNDEGIETVIVPDGVKEIEMETFAYNNSIEEVVVPESVTYIGEYCFTSCKSLKKVKLPSSLKTIESGLFSGCEQLIDVIIPEKTEVIESGAFRNCKSLQSIIFPESLIKIGNNAFNGCTKLESINLSEKVIIGESAFDGCKSLNKGTEFVIIGGELSAYNGKSAEVIIPDGVKKVGTAAFNKNKRITKVVFPDSVETIELEAFKNCSNLKEVKLPAKITEISRSMFWDCKSLAKIVVPEGVTLIGENAFRHCYSLEEIQLPYSVKSIQKKAFSGTLEGTSTDIHTVIIAPGTNIEEIESPEDKFAAAIGYLKKHELYQNPTVIKSYQEYIGKRKSALLPVIFGNDLSHGLEAFIEAGIITSKNYKQYFESAQRENALECVAFLLDWKNKIDKGDIQENKTKGKKAKDPFSISAMKKNWKFSIINDNEMKIDRYIGSDEIVDIPERIGDRTVTRIGSYAFEAYRNKNTSLIHTVTIPKAVKEIGFRAFSGCASLKTIVWPKDLSIIGDFAFSECTSLKKTQLPDGLKEIGFRTFEGCSNLTSIRIPDSVERIGDDAFAINTGSFLNQCVNESDYESKAHEVNSNLWIITKLGSYASEYALKYAITCADE